MRLKSFNLLNALSMRQATRKIEARRTIAFSASLALSIPPRSDTNRVTRSRARRAYQRHPSTPGKSSLPFVTRLRAWAFVTFKVRLSSDISCYPRVARDYKHLRHIDRRFV
jgi:hypothetical protein